MCNVTYLVPKTYRHLSEIKKRQYLTIQLIYKSG